MKLTIARDVFLTGLSAAQNVINGRTTLPILSHVLMTATDGRVTFNATDLDMETKSSVETKVDAHGSVALPGKRLLEIARFVAGPEIAIEVNDKNVAAIRSGNSVFKLRGLAAAEWSTSLAVRDDVVFELPQSRLKAMMATVAFATCEDQSRHVLLGIQFDTRKDGLVVTATRGYCLATVTEPITAKPVEFILPQMACIELMRLLGDTGTAYVTVTENRAMFQLCDEQGGEVVFIAKLIEGKYPNWKQVVPTDSKVKIKLPVIGLLKAARRVRVMTSEKASQITLRFTKGNLTITAQAPDSGEASESMDIPYPAGIDIATAMNPTYLIEALSHLPDAEIELSLIDPLNPLVFRGKDSLIIIMPMRLA